jgi:hypothetical protein
MFASPSFFQNLIRRSALSTRYRPDKVAFVTFRKDRNHQCSCGCEELFRNSPSAFPGSLSMSFLRFLQVFFGFFRFCSIFGYFSEENAQIHAKRALR